MSSKFFNTIAFRLTLWFSGVFTICSGVAFILFYFLASQTLEQQIDQELLDNASKFTAIIRRNGLPGARELAVVQSQAAGEKVVFFRLLYPSGEVFATSNMPYWKGTQVNRDILAHLIMHKNNIFETITMPSSGQKARILYSLVASNAILQTGIAMDAYGAFLLAFKKVFVSAMGFIILFSALAGWLLVQKVMSGVSRITKTANNITASNLEDRVAKAGTKDELDQLASTFNSMLDRIEALVKSNREITDNIAHDLKSPITRIRGHAELALIQEDSLKEYRSMAASTIEESDRLLDMINTMLLISKARASEDDFEFTSCDLSRMVEEACELFEPLADDKQISFEHDIRSGIVIQADVRMLQRAFSNLLDNAIKYTSEGGKIRVGLSAAGERVSISVTDTGMGVEPEYHDKIFKRFYRAESSRTSPGTGLGLSLAKAIVKKHKGDIFLESRPGRGSSFVISLPYSNLEII